MNFRYSSTSAQKNKASPLVALPQLPCCDHYTRLRSITLVSSKRSKWSVNFPAGRLHPQTYRLARYRAQLLEPTSKSGAAGTGFDVQKSGDARVALIGFPSVGKVRQALCSEAHSSYYDVQSTLLSKTTHTTSETAAYEFTTLTVSIFIHWTLTQPL